MLVGTAIALFIKRSQPKKLFKQSGQHWQKWQNYRVLFYSGSLKRTLMVEMGVISCKYGDRAGNVTVVSVGQFNGSVKLGSQITHSIKLEKERCSCVTLTGVVGGITVGY
jgi:hypothetical protein